MGVWEGGLEVRLAVPWPPVITKSHAAAAATGNIRACCFCVPAPLMVHIQIAMHRHSESSPGGNTASPCKGTATVLGAARATYLANGDRAEGQSVPDVQFIFIEYERVGERSRLDTKSQLVRTSQAAPQIL
jgi:hypothetical protein